MSKNDAPYFTKEVVYNHNQQENVIQEDSYYKTKPKHIVFPSDLFFDTNLSKQAKFAYILIGTFSPTGYCTITADVLAPLLNCSIRRVQSSIKELEDKGYLIRKTYRSKHEPIVERRLYLTPIYDDSIPLIKGIAIDIEYLGELNSIYSTRNFNI